MQDNAQAYPTDTASIDGLVPGAGDGLPAVRRMYNLYHPFDPVAYRMEPLIVAGAEKRRPVYAVSPSRMSWQE